MEMGFVDQRRLFLLDLNLERPSRSAKPGLLASSPTRAPMWTAVHRLAEYRLSEAAILGGKGSEKTNARQKVVAMGGKEKQLSTALDSGCWLDVQVCVLEDIIY